jgi:divalent metal cation (Fe/Co/Zn/Cd) transporter
VLVFDPLAVALVLAYNIAKGGSVLKETKQLLVDQPVLHPKTKTIITEEVIEEVVPELGKTRKYSAHQS